MLNLNLNTTSSRKASEIAIDPDAQAFLTAAGITDPTQITAVNNLTLGLKANSLWTKMVAVYPFVGGTATSHKWNLVDPRDLDAAYRITWNGGITHNASGVKGNGVDGFGGLRINDLAWSGSQGFFGYSNFETGALGSDSLWGYNGILDTFLNPRNATDQLATRLDTLAGVYNAANATSVGFYGYNRENTSQYRNYYNGTEATVSYSDSTPNSLLRLLMYNTNFSQRRLASFYATNGLLHTEMSTLASLDLAFQTTLSRT